MSATTERKQNYLFDEIIQQGYDGEAFMNFMAEQKDDGTNIEKWNMTELINIVSEYKTTFAQNGVELQSQEDNFQSNSSIKSESQNEIKQQSNQPSQPYGASPGQQYNAPQHTSQQSQSQSQYSQQQPQQRNQQQQQQQQQHQQRQQYQQQQSMPISSQAQQNQYQQRQASQNYSQANQPQQQQRTNNANNQNYNNLQSAQQRQQQQSGQKYNSTTNIKNNKDTNDDDDPFASILKNTTHNNNHNTNTNPSGQSKQPNSTKPSFGLGGEKPKNNFNNSNIDPWNNNSAANFMSLPQVQQPQYQSTQKQFDDPFAQFAASTSTSNKSNSNQADPFDSFFSSTPQPKPIEQQQSQLQKQPKKQAVFDFDSLLSDDDTTEKPTPNIEPKPDNSVIGDKRQTTKPTQAGTFNSGGLSLVPASVGMASKIKNTTNAEPDNGQKRRKSIEIKKPDFNDDIYASFSKPTPVIPTDTTFMFEKECKLGVSTVVGVSGEVNVVINDHSVLTGSLFSMGGSHIILYAVNTLPFNWVVKRKYQDFLWLRNLLVKLFPTISIPPLPKNTSLNEKLIQRRKGYFESFLNELLSHPDIKSSKPITDFLSVVDDKTFKVKVKEYEKLRFPRIIAEIETTTGKIILNRNPNCSTHSAALAEFFEGNDREYDKLKKLQKQLVEAYGSVGNVLHQIGDTFAQLNLNSVNFNKKAAPSAQVKGLEDTYVMLNNIFVQQGNRFTSEIKLFETHFYDFFKYHKDNFVGFKQILKTRNDLASALSKKDGNEGSGLGSIFRSSTSSNVYSPQKTLKDLEEQVAYFNQCVVDGSKKMLENRTEVYSKHFIEYCEIHKAISDKMGSMWQDIADNFQNILLKQPVMKSLMTFKKPPPAGKSKEHA